ncbi:hypothetical protein KAI12_02475, partial [Candidatus Bathyarchaeota archaeon]|nr:hypothetical protein [Candidatus Bathyarchaeota archaeon]
MQWAYHTSFQRLSPLIKESNDKGFQRLWRYFQTSDHLYYMFTAGGGPGEVHSYFSPFQSPIDAFIAAQTSIFDFENRLRIATLAANEPFLFYVDGGDENFTGEMAWSLKGFARALQEVSEKSLEFHNSRGDLEKWVKHSLRDEKLSRKLRETRRKKLKGAPLRKEIVSVVEERYNEISSQAQNSTKAF